MVYYPTVFIVSTSSSDWNAIRGWSILYFQVVTRARWTTVTNINVFNDQHNAFSFTCYNFPAAFLVRRVRPWIVRTSKNSWWLIQGCHIWTDFKQYIWTERKYRGQLELYHFKKRIYLTWEGIRSKPNAGRTKQCNGRTKQFWDTPEAFFKFVSEIAFWKLSRLYCEQVTDNWLPSYYVFENPFRDSNEH